MPFTILHAHAPVAVLEARVAARAKEGRDPSEADVEVLHRQLRSHEQLQVDESGCAIALATNAPVDVPQLVRAWRAAPRAR